jgi:hypothetical protein
MIYCSGIVEQLCICIVVTEEYRCSRISDAKLIRILRFFALAIGLFTICALTFAFFSTGKKHICPNFCEIRRNFSHLATFESLIILECISIVSDEK